MMWLAPTAVFAAIPAIVATSSSQVTTNLSIVTSAAGVTPVTTSTWVPGKVAVDTNGNLFVADGGNGAVWEIPSSGATPFYIVKGYSGINGVALDSANNLYATNPYGSVGGGGVYRIPFQNGTYNVAAATNLVGNFGSLDGYYMQSTDLAVDNAGYAYFACGAAGCGGSHSMFKVKTDGTNPIILVKTLTTAPTGVAVDTAGNLYFADGTSVYTVATNSTGATPTVIGTGFKTPKGVTVDAANNLYVADTTGGLIYVIPFEITSAYPAGGPNPAHQYLLTTGINSTASAGIDALGNLYLGDGYASRSVNKLTVGGAVFPSSAVGATSAAVVTFTFNTAATPASIAYLQSLTSTGSPFTVNYAACAANTAQAAGSSCTTHINFKPTTAGLQAGACVLRDSTGAALATAYLSGTGNGAAATFDPGVQTTLPLSSTAAIVAPSAIAYDAAGNAYVADTSTNQIVVFPAGGGQGTAIAGTSLLQPSGVAVDGAGNLLISDGGNNRLVGIANVGGVLSGSKQVTLATGLKSPQGVAIGPDGAIYVADTGNTRVLRYATWQGWGSLLQTSVGTGYLLPVALAVDGASNVSVVDSTANLLSRVNQFGGSQATVLSALSAPTGVGMDAAGNVYIVNSGSRSVSRYLNKAGVLDPNSGITLGSSLAIPTGVAVNGSGNAVIADGGSQTIYGLVRSSGAVNFGSVNDGDSSAANLITLSNAGNLALTLGTPAYTEAGASANYVIAASTSGGCAGGATLASGAACGYTASFIPIATGTLTDTLSFSSNSVSTAAPTLTLTGIGTNLSPTATSVAQTSPGGTVIYGQPASFTATVVSKRAGYTPTGTVTFIVDGQRLAAQPLSTTAPYIATTTITTFSGGAHSIGVTYNGDANNASSSASALAVTVAKASSVITLTVSPSIAIAPGSAALFNVTAASATTGTPTGTVNLVAGGKIIATGVLSVGTIPAGLSVTTLPVGVYQVTAQYLGDVNFNTSSSSAVSVTVRNPDFDIQMSTTTLTVKAGSSGSLPITIQPISGFGGFSPTLFNATLYPGYTYTPPPALGAPTVTLPCTGLPANATCTFAPGYLNFNALNPESMVLTVNTNVASNTTLPYPSGMPFLPGVLGGLGVLLAVLGAPKQWRLRSMRLTVMLVMIAGSLIAMSGCGAGLRLQATNNVTPTGTYPITLTFSAAQNAGAGSFTATLTPGSNVLTNVSSLNLLAAGQTVTGGSATTGAIPASTLITAVSSSGNTVTLSNPIPCATSPCVPTPVNGVAITDSDEVLVHTVNMTLIVQ